MAGPTPSTSAWREVLALFDRWAATDAAGREAELQRVQAEQPTLYPRLLAMIEADQAAEARDFLGGDASPLPTETQHAGLRLGAWELREPIGRGGMGQVWLATRSDGLYSGRAAVKLLHAASTGAQAQARFAREGEFLARLSHPHIAQLLDAGLMANGTRYLVLEYVPGERIDHWCDTRQLGIAERQRLFMQVCEAVSYAHAHLVVHRDLKPANILVSDDGHVKLLDFGVAKLLVDADEAADLTELTKAGSAGLTPEYAAPEQIEGAAITTATDVYALGVVLFALLCGARPYGGSSRGVAAMARAIVEEPPRSLLTALRESPDAALSRHASLASLEQALRGDLETIVAKALKKAPQERYATVQELRDDLQRHLNHQPVSAQPDTFGYRAAKFAQRNRVQVVALVAVMFTLVGGIVATSWQWRVATQEAARTRSVVKVLTDIFTDLTPDQTGTAQVPVLDLLRKGWGQTRQSLKSDPALQGEVARPLGLMLESSGDMGTASEALTISRAHLLQSGQRHSAPYLQVLQGLAYAKSRLGETEEARKLLSEIIAVADEMNDKTSIEPINARIELGQITRREGRMPEAYEQLTRAAELARQRLGLHHSSYVFAMQELAIVTRELGRWQQTRQILAEIASATQGGKPIDSTLARYNLATLEVELGQYRSATTQLRDVIGDLTKLYGSADTFTTVARSWLSISLFHSGAFDESDAVMMEALHNAQQSKEADVQHSLQMVMARQWVRRGRCDKAEPLLRDSLAHFESGNATLRPYVQRTRMLLAECELRRGQVDGSLRSLNKVLDAQRDIYGKQNLDLWPTLLLRAIALDGLLGAAAAQPAYEEASTMALALLPPGHPDRLLADVLRDQVRWRTEASSEANRRLSASITAYGKVLRERPDFSGYSVLANKLLETQAAAKPPVSTLLSLLTY